MNGSAPGLGGGLITIVGGFVGWVYCRFHEPWIILRSWKTPSWSPSSGLRPLVFLDSLSGGMWHTLVLEPHHSSRAPTSDSILVLLVQGARALHPLELGWDRS